MNSCLFCQELILDEINFLDWSLSKTQSAKYICDFCLSKFELIGDLFCSECGRRQKNSKICSDCSLWMQKNDSIHLNHRAIFIYNQMAKDFFNKFKFIGDYRLKNSFDDLIEKHLPIADTYISIPISQATLSTRGFNQVNAIFSVIPVEKKLLMANNKSIQSHNSRRERLQVTNPFYLNPEGPDVIKGKNVVIIDDIYTTGATIRNAAEVLATLLPKSIKSFSLIR